MSRSGYTDDYDEDGTGGLWRGAVARAIKGKRGQAALRETLAALESMPQKVLIGESLVTADGEFCTLGALGSARGLDMRAVDPDDWDAVAALFDIAPAMVREIVYENDEGTDTHEWIDVVICGPMPPYHFPPYGHKTHERSVRVRIDPLIIAKQRWLHMHSWVTKHLPAATDGAQHG
ncbi:hypothetical protein [Comamonas testosteroni]|uniref:hypothetical protein n=1 Tax=Comamonas testosteroni TaxID=285 RepID=UPI00068C62DA|nr:hypothetical protein [Comamonas testosteroni]